MTKVTTRVVITQDGETYNWHVTHSLDAHQMNGPGRFETAEAAIDAAPSITGWEYVIPEMVNAPSPLLN